MLFRPSRLLEYVEHFRITYTDKARVRAAFGENYDRLGEVKAKWDPDDRLRSTRPNDSR